MSNVEQGISNIEVLNRKSERNLLGLLKIPVYRGWEVLQSQRSFFPTVEGNDHFEIHVIEIRYSIFKPPSRGRLEPTRSAGGESVVYQ